MPERDYSNDPWDDPDYRPSAPSASDPPSDPPWKPADNSGNPYADWNGGSPPDAPLSPGFGWEWSGTWWEQVPGRGLGYVNPDTPTPTPTDPGPHPGPYNPGPTPAGPTIQGVPKTFSGGGGGAASNAVAVPAWNNSPVPTLEDAINESKKLAPAPVFTPAPDFAPPTPVDNTDRDRIIKAILQNPDVMGQTQQDALFEQQKEAQNLLAHQAKGRLAQDLTARGFTGRGGEQQAGNVKLEQGFINSLLAGKRDIATQAATLNRASQQAAVEMSDAVTQGDFARAHDAYQTQLQAKSQYDDLRLKAAQFDQSNVALASQSMMANRQQSFQEYLDTLKYNEMLRQFNEQLAYNYGNLQWNQQMDVANLFGGK